MTIRIRQSMSSIAIALLRMGRWVRCLSSDHVIRLASTGWWQHASLTVLIGAVVVSWLGGRSRPNTLCRNAQPETGEGSRTGLETCLDPRRTCPTHQP